MERLTKQESRKTKRILEAKFGMFLVCCKLITLLFRKPPKNDKKLHTCWKLWGELENFRLVRRFLHFITSCPHG